MENIFVLGLLFTLSIGSEYGQIGPQLLIFALWLPAVKSSHVKMKLF